jgi:hypothetical protein
MATQRDQYLQVQASESLEPGALGQRPEQARGQVFVSAPHTAQFGVGTAPEQRGKHHATDLGQ